MVDKPEESKTASAASSGKPTTNGRKNKDATTPISTTTPTYYSRRVDVTVREIWSETPGLGMHDLLQQVKLRLSNSTNTDYNEDDNNIDDDAILKRQIKAAKLALPYRQLNSSSSHPDAAGVLLSSEKEDFVRQKIQERSSLRAERRLAEADRIAAGLQAMGIQIDDHKKTWTAVTPPLVEEASSSSPHNDDGDETTTTATATGVKCDLCGRSFASRNLVFKHLRDPVTSCGNSLFAANQTLAQAPSTIQQQERKKRLVEQQQNNKQNQQRRRNNTGQTAEHLDHSLWMGDLPLLWTRHGGNYKRLRALLRAHLPRTVAPPWIKHVKRKAYRSSSRNSSENPEANNGDCTTTNRSSESRGAEGVYLGYAIVVFRDAQETETVLKELNGREITVHNVFSRDLLESNPDFAKLATEEKAPPFRLKVLRHVQRSNNTSSSNGEPTEQQQQKEVAAVGVGEDPPLEDQLKPLSTKELLLRTKRLYDQHNNKKTSSTTNSAATAKAPLNNRDEGDDDDNVDKKVEEDEDEMLHKDALERAVAAYQSLNIRRPEIRHQGRLIPTAIRDRLLDILRDLRWAVPNHRKGLTAERYLVLQTNVTNDLFYQHLRDACRALMDWADADYYYSGIAVTMNFVSSPHIDDRDQSFQYAVSLGDFRAGGELCVDGRDSATNIDVDHNNEVIHVVDTHNRIARVDGRHVHWVRPWEGGDRYSLIFYDTSDRQPTAIMPIGVDC